MRYAEIFEIDPAECAHACANTTQRRAIIWASEPLRLSQKGNLNIKSFLTSDIYIVVNPVSKSQTITKRNKAQNKYNNKEKKS